MRSPLKFFFYIAAVELIQLAVVPVFQLGRMTPQVVLAAVIWLAFNATEKKMLTALLFCGFFMDLYSGLPFGVLTFAFLLSAAFIDFLINTVFPKEGALYLFGSALVLGQLVFEGGVYGGQWLLASLRGEMPIPLEEFFSWYFLGQLFTTLVLGYLLAYLSDKIFKPRAI